MKDMFAIAEFVDKIDKAYEEFKQLGHEPLIENVTIMIHPEDLETLKSLFVDGLRLKQIEQDRDAIDAYTKLHKNIFFQLPPELMF